MGRSLLNYSNDIRTTGVVLWPYLLALLLGVLSSSAFSFWMPLLILGPLFVFVVWSLPRLKTPPFRALNRLFVLFLGLFVLWPPYAVLNIAHTPGISPQRIVYGLVVMVWVFCLLTSPDVATLVKQRLKANQFVVSLFAILLFLKCASIFVSDFPLNSVYGFFNETLNHFLLFLVVIGTVRSLEDIKAAAFALVACGLVVCLLAIYEAVVKHNIFEWMPVTTEYMKYAIAAKMRDSSYRVTSTFWHPLLLVEFLVFLLPLCVYFLLRPVGRIPRFVAFVTLILIPVVQYKTGARSGLATMAVTVTLLVGLMVLRNLKFKKSNLGRYLLVLALPLMVGAAFLVAGEISHLIHGRSSSEHASSGYRLMMLQRGTRLVLEHPILGYGVRRSADVLNFIDDRGQQIIDNYYLSVALDSGVLAAILSAILLWYFIWLGFKLSLKHAGHEGVVAGVLAISLVGFAVMNMIIAEIQNFQLMFMAFAMLLVLKEKLAHDSFGKNLGAFPQILPEAPIKASLRPR